MNKTVSAHVRSVGIVDPDFPSPAAARVFFSGPRTQCDRALSKLSRRVALGKVVDVAGCSASAAAFGAVVGLATQPHTAFALSVCAALVGLPVAVARACWIASDANDPFEKDERVRRAAEKMVGESVSSTMAMKLNSAIQRKRGR